VVLDISKSPRTKPGGEGRASVARMAKKGGGGVNRLSVMYRAELDRRMVRSE